MRKKAWARPELAHCPNFISSPEEWKGRWGEWFAEKHPIHLELGCGKGRFTADTAEQNPDSLLVAIEKVADAMIIGMERAYDRGIENVRFIDADVLALPVIFAQGEVDRIFLNFSDPWPKNRDAKHRLTSPDFLSLYENVLKPEGEIHFKTDNVPLFEYSVETLVREGWTLSEVSRDLHADGIVGVMTDYEAKFHEQGVKINRLVAKKEKR